MMFDEVETRRTLERYSMAVSVSGDGIWEYPAIDPLQAFHKEIPVYYSPRFAELLGYTAEEFPLVAGSWWDAIHPADVEKSSQAIADHLATRDPLRVEYRVRNRRGDIRWWQVRGGSMPDAEHPGKIRAIGVVRDITELKSAEEMARARLELITQQQQAIRELSTPVIQVWEDIITMPLVGVVDARRASEVMERLVAEVSRLRSRFAVLDMTGVDEVDATTAEELGRIIKAVGLLGASVRLSGLRPAVAQTMVDLGVDVSPFVTHRNLMDALQACIRDRSRKHRS